MLTHIVVGLNVAANALGNVFVFVGFVPGWLSATLIAVLSGTAMLVVFKYTSNQRAIKRCRQDIRANLLAVKLFHDNLLVGFRAQGRVLFAAFRLLLLASVPMLAMLVPMMLLLAQLSLWYQARPLRKDEEAVITLKLKDAPESYLTRAELEATDAVKDTHGPVRVQSQREICWNVRANHDGCHRLTFRLDGQTIEKELAIGSGFMRISARRPEWNWIEALLYPCETPFSPESLVQSIEVQYPPRSSWTSGTDYWVYYWISLSLVTSFCCRGLFKVNL